MGSQTPPIGTRVGALATKQGKIVFLFGYGTYKGEEVPPDMGGVSLTRLLHASGEPNPKIVLDNGDVVWGCECWWASEESIKEAIETGELGVVDLTIDDFRRGRFPQVMTDTPTSDFWSA